MKRDEYPQGSIVHTAFALVVDKFYYDKDCVVDAYVEAFGPYAAYRLEMIAKEFPVVSKEIIS